MLTLQQPLVGVGPLQASVPPACRSLLTVRVVGTDRVGQRVREKMPSLAVWAFAWSCAQPDSDSILPLRMSPFGGARLKSCAVCVCMQMRPATAGEVEALLKKMVAMAEAVGIRWVDACTLISVNARHLFQCICSNSVKLLLRMHFLRRLSPSCRLPLSSHHYPG